MKSTVQILVILLVLAMPALSAGAQLCEGTLYNNLIPGDTAIVVTDFVLNVRSEPSLKGDLLAQLEPDTELPVTGGPVCADGYSWYEVQFQEDSTGWVAEADHEEYWLGKLPRVYTTYERPADPNGSSPAVRFTYPEASVERIDFDSASILGSTYAGEQIILRPLAGEPIFITAIPFEEFRDTPGGGWDRAEVLQILVNEWSDVALEATYAYPNNEGAWPTIVGLKNFEEFQNGQGFSYIAAYVDTDNLVPVDRDSFWYAFHGMTDDGAYFVTITMPIQVPQLPEAPPSDPDDMTEYFAGYLPWIGEVRESLRAQAPASLSPTYSLVKGIVYSLEIE